MSSPTIPPVTSALGLLAGLRTALYSCGLAFRPGWFNSFMLNGGRGEDIAGGEKNNQARGSETAEISKVILHAAVQNYFGVKNTLGF